MPNVILDITGMKNAAALVQIANLINASQDAPPLRFTARSGCAHGSKPNDRVGRMFLDTWDNDWNRGDF